MSSIIWAKSCWLAENFQREIAFRQESEYFLQNRKTNLSVLFNVAFSILCWYTVDRSFCYVGTLRINAVLTFQAHCWERMFRCGFMNHLCMLSVLQVHGFMSLSVLITMAKLLLFYFSEMYGEHTSLRATFNNKGKRQMFNYGKRSTNR